MNIIAAIMVSSVVSIQQIASDCGPSWRSNLVVLVVKVDFLVTVSSNEQYQWLDIISDSVCDVIIVDILLMSVLIGVVGETCFLLYI